MAAATRDAIRGTCRPHGGLLLAVVALLATCGPALSQVRQPGEGISAGEGAGILSDVSTNIGAGSRSMHDGALTIGETSGGPVRSGPVRDPNTRGMLSGPVSSMSRGPVYERRGSLSGGSMTEASAGTVKQDSSHPLGTRISDPLRELGPLQEQMRAKRQLAEQAALQGAMQPAVDATLEMPADLPDDLAELDVPYDEPLAADDAVQHEGGEPAVLGEDADAEFAQ